MRLDAKGRANTAPPACFAIVRRRCAQSLSEVRLVGDRDVIVEQLVVVLGAHLLDERLAACVDNGGSPATACL